MKINVNKVREDLTKLNKLIDEYEEVYLNLHNQINNSSYFWSDINSKKFYNNSELEKSKINIFIEELKTFRDVYYSLVKSYEKIANNIIVNLKSKEDLCNKFDAYINKMQVIIDKFNVLDLTSIEERGQILSVKQTFINNKNEALASKKKIVDLYDRIKKIESNINSKIANLDVKVLSQINIKEYV